jgi:beta-galactosidase
LPAGIGWYRKHFALPQALSSKRVFTELDGVMANSDVYFNGVHLGNRPYGYVGFRYELTANAKFGTADNVLSVKCDNSAQPASRYYAGAGIYRHVRLIATDPVHVDQWASFVTTPQVTTTAATVHVTTVVVNQGTAAQMVTVQGVVSDPSGIALAPVSAAAQSLAAGKSGTFSFDVPVANPKLWDTATPNMYSLSTKVQVGTATVDDDVTSFGIRTLVFDSSTGLSLNGKSLKLKGVATHEDSHVCDHRPGQHRGGGQRQPDPRVLPRQRAQGVQRALFRDRASDRPRRVTLTASSAGLTGGTVTIQAAAGTFTPCSGSCD